MRFAGTLVILVQFIGDHNAFERKEMKSLHSKELLQIKCVSWEETRSLIHPPYLSKNRSTFTLVS